MSSTKTCSRCHKTLPATVEFWYRCQGALYGLYSRCKECCSQRDKAFYAVNREKRLLQHRTWCQGNRQHIRQYGKAYYEQHREELLSSSKEYKKAYYYAHRDEDLKRRKEHYEAHKEQHRESCRKYQELNKERLRPSKAASSARRRARIKQVGGSFSGEDINRKYGQQNGCCWWCSSPLEKRWHLDHVIPLIKGGTNDSSNIVLSCPSCNLRKGAKLPSQFCGRIN